MIRTNYYMMLSKGNGKDQGPIYLRVKGLDNRLNLSTGINESTKDWDRKKERFRSRHPNAYLLNRQLDEMEKKVMAYVEQATRKEELLTALGVKSHMNGKETPKETLIQAIDQFVVQHKGDLSHGTIKQYGSLKTVVLEFVTSAYRQSDINLEHLNYAFVTKFKTHMEQVRNNHPNTVNKQITRLKTVLNWVIKLDWISQNPFRNFSSTTVPTVKSYLNIHEIEQFERLELSNSTLELVRDGFLFMCYTGLAYVDIRSLKQSNIQTSIDRTKILRLSRKKTNEYCLVPLIDNAIALIEKYKGHPMILDSEGVIPVLSNQKMNDYLKVLKDSAGIAKNVTCHVGRHSFATNALEFGVPIETVSKALGHRSIKTTQIYAKITEKKLNRDFRLFETGFSGDRSITNKAI
jgi:site-specific recombinase XerD